MSGQEAAALESLKRAQEGIGSRFETQTSIDEAKARKEEEWKNAYARIGQEPPKVQEDVVHDGRTLYERLQLNKQMKTEEWDEKMKLSNQYRGLDTEEYGFLAARAREQREKERQVADEESREIASYREALAAKHAAESAAAEEASSTPAPQSGPSAPKVPMKAVRKDVKSLLKGVVVKKKQKPEASKGAVVKESVTKTTGKREADGEADKAEAEKRAKVDS